MRTRRTYLESEETPAGRFVQDMIGRDLDGPSAIAIQVGWIFANRRSATTVLRVNENDITGPAHVDPEHLVDACLSRYTISGLMAGTGMQSAIAAVVLLAFTPTVVVAQAFDWSAQLGKSPSALQATLGQAGRCASGGFTVPVRWVNRDTTLSDSLFDPVDTPGSGFISIGGKPDPTTDYDEERAFSSNKLSSIRCTIGREATVEAYAYEDRLVRIKLSFDRCDSRELREDRFFGNIMGSDKPFMAEQCDGVDLKEKDFDTALYQSIKARNKYGYDSEGSPGMLDFQWSGDMYSEYAWAERRAMWDVLCYRHARDELSRMIPPDGTTYRCLIDVENADPSRWSSTAMYEFLYPGTFFDSVASRLTAIRLFVDMPAERAAALAIRPELQTMVDGIKSRIAARVKDGDDKEGAVSNILGVGN
ncbi:hypothetical protein [Rhizobium leguminosarum]|uniref:hypothetical protein n=1 Tax=Rhizobium leguminosarum TaxID=384 RepID=UPI00103C0620|nr:hypothetical protein [Rhizobium leguminosarum]TCA26249.1 hypothetical protein E0H67_04840 [Rhizobium leguminosarum bv. viciae]